ncbi:hypothetical protein LINPERPRIM_LOCUS33935 [Linum perenne]
MCSCIFCHSRCVVVFCHDHHCRKVSRIRIHSSPDRHLRSRGCLPEYRNESRAHNDRRTVQLLTHLAVRVFNFRFRRVGRIVDLH